MRRSRSPVWIRPSKSTIASLYSASVRLFSGTMRHLLARQGFGRTVNEQNIPLVVERVHEFLQVLLAPLCFILRHVVPLLSAFRSESLQVRPRRSRIYAVGLLGTLFRRRLFGFPSLLPPDYRHACRTTALRRRNSVLFHRL